MSIHKTLEKHIKIAVKNLHEVDLEMVEFQPTRKDFEGDVTVVVFPMLKQVKINPAVLGEEIGKYLEENVAEVAKFNVVKGFLNLILSDAHYLKNFNQIRAEKDFGKVISDVNAKSIMVEYSSPNTNKPLHLGHIRNILLGHSISEILKASGNKVFKTQIINDRGIHICKSMLAWKKFGKDETPESSGMKGDKLVGKYYVEFDKQYKKEVEALVKGGKSEEEEEEQAPILLEAQKMLQAWESGDQETVALWKKMNQWVYEGFEKTYREIGVDFDKNYYESNTYLLGKEVVKEGLEK